jgi:ABC-type oligopeptide transport system substrate-binding subunit
MLPTIQANAAKIGITFAVRSVNGAYPVIQTTSKNIPISTRPRWFKDYADPSTFVDPLFKGSSIIPSGNTNYALVGVTPSQVKSLGLTGSTSNVPSIDAAANKCGQLIGNSRINCYAALDKVLTSQIVPWVPYMWAKTVTILSPNVTKWNFDQNAGFTALAHVAVKG